MTVLAETFSGHSIILLKDSIHSKSETILSALSDQDKSNDVTLKWYSSGNGTSMAMRRDAANAFLKGKLDNEPIYLAEKLVEVFVAEATAKKSGSRATLIENLIVFDLFNELELLDFAADGGRDILKLGALVMQSINALKDCCKRLIIVYHSDLDPSYHPAQSQSSASKSSVLCQLEYIATLSVAITPLSSGKSNDADGMATFTRNGHNGHATATVESTGPPPFGTHKYTQSYLFKRSPKGDKLEFTLI